MMVHRPLLAAAVYVALVTGAAAETKLTDFNGEWRGSGQERDSPLQYLQATTCRNIIRASAKRMQSEMTCESKSGGSKLIRMTVTLEGDQLTGKIMRRATQPGRGDAVLRGAVSGKKTDKSANLLVRWQGATPNTTVHLKLNTPTSYSMQATALGITMMDLTLNRIAERAPARR
jgi:hypothetical protein